MDLNVYHNHHIIPKHLWKKWYGDLNGVNNSSNIERLTPKEHAERHYELWVICGYTEDYLAWKGLSNQLSNTEINFLKSKLGGYTSKGRIKSEKEKKKLSDSWTPKRKQELAELAKIWHKGKPKTKEHIAKLPQNNKGKIYSQEYIDKQIKTHNEKYGKPVATPFGNFQSIKDCARKIGLPKNTIKYRAKKEIMGYRFLNKVEIS